MTACVELAEQYRKRGTLVPFRPADTEGMRPHAPLSIEDYDDLSAEMLYRACPNLEDEPFFTLHMGVAVHLGLTWIECLQYVLELRRGVVH